MDDTTKRAFYAILRESFCALDNVDGALWNLYHSQEARRSHGVVSDAGLTLCCNGAIDDIKERLTDIHWLLNEENEQANEGEQALKETRDDDSPMITITDFCRLFDICLDLHFSAAENEWTAIFCDVDIFDKGGECRPSGKGSSPRDALDDYIDLIEGKRMRLTKNRDAEFSIPNNLCLDKGL